MGLEENDFRSAPLLLHVAVPSSHDPSSLALPRPMPCGGISSFITVSCVPSSVSTMQTGLRCVLTSCWFVFLCCSKSVLTITISCKRPDRMDSRKSCRSPRMQVCELSRTSDLTGRPEEYDPADTRECERPRKTGEQTMSLCMLVSHVV
jgi:hypothetical protein